MVESILVIVIWIAAGYLIRIARGEKLDLWKKEN